MKIVKESQAELFDYASTSKCLDYSMELNKKNLDFCINNINGRYPEKGYCSNTECEEICYILEGNGKFVKKDETMKFEKGDIIYIDQNEIYFWEGNFKLAIVCSPAWSKEQCKLYDEEDF